MLPRLGRRLPVMRSRSSWGGAAARCYAALPLPFFHFRPGAADKYWRFTHVRAGYGALRVSFQANGFPIFGFQPPPPGSHPHVQQVALDSGSCVHHPVPPVSIGRTWTARRHGVYAEWFGLRLFARLCVCIIQPGRAIAAHRYRATFRLITIGAGFRIRAAFAGPGAFRIHRLRGYCTTIMAITPQAIHYSIYCAYPGLLPPPLFSGVLFPQAALFQASTQLAKYIIY